MLLRRVQLAAPFLMSSQTAALPSTRANWYQVDITGAGWPLMSPESYDWVAVTPSQPLTMTTQNNNVYNGAVWAGTDDTINPATTGSAGEPLLYKGRQFISQRFAGDSQFGGNTVSAVNRNRDLLSWGTQTGSSQYTNWAAAPYNSTIRYGIQLLGWQVFPPATLSGGHGEIIEALRSACTRLESPLRRLDYACAHRIDLDDAHSDELCLYDAHCDEHCR